MSRTSTSTRTRVRRAAVVVGAAGGLALLAPSAAQANIGYGATLQPGQSACVQQYAGYAVRGEGTATRAGAKFKVQYAGATIYGTPPTTTGFAAEFRSVWGNFPGPGYYQVCAVNNNSTPTLVNIRILVDAEF